MKRPGTQPGRDSLALTVAAAVAFVSFVAAVWRGVRDDFVDFFRSEECLQLAEAAT